MRFLNENFSFERRFDVLCLCAILCHATPWAMLIEPGRLSNSSRCLSLTQFGWRAISNRTIVWKVSAWWRPESGHDHLRVWALNARLGGKLHKLQLNYQSTVGRWQVETFESGCRIRRFDLSEQSLPKRNKNEESFFQFMNYDPLYSRKKRCSQGLISLFLSFSLSLSWRMIREKEICWEIGKEPVNYRR